MRLLECDGVTIGRLEMPQFVLSERQHLAVVIPVEYGEEWHIIMQILAGDRESSTIRIHSKPGLIVAPGFSAESVLSADILVQQYIAEEGVSNEQSIAIASDLRIDSRVPYFELSLTDRFMLNLRVQLLLGADYLVYTTSGLDPQGRNAVVTTIEKILPCCAAIQVISRRLLDWNNSNDVFTNIVELSTKANTEMGSG